MKQREMPFLNTVKAPSLVPLDLIKQCTNRLDAIRLCAQLAGMTHEVISERLGIDKGHWSRILQGQANFPDAKSVDLMYLCGNYAPMQFEAFATGFDLVERSKDARIKELEQQLAQLKAA